MPTANTGLSIINVMRVRVCGMFMVMVINAYLIDELNYCTPLSLSLFLLSPILYALLLLLSLRSGLSGCSLVEMGRSDDVIDDGDDWE